MRRKIIITFLCLLSFLQISAQLKIRIADIDTNQSISNAFVYNEAYELLGITDDEGNFIINNEVDKILILADGFEKKTETIGKLSKTIFIFKSHRNNTSDSKALYILKKLWENRTKNNPDYLNNYQFDSYVKFTLDIPSDSLDSIPYPKTKLDFLNNNFKSLLERNLFFIGERTMLYKYDNKYGEKAIVTAYKAGGFNNPEFFKSAISQSLVNDYPEILKPREIQTNISKLTDSLYINGKKTYEIYTYSKGKNETQFYRSLTIFIDAESFALVKLLGNTSAVSDTYYEIIYTPYKNVWFAQSEYMKTKILSKSFIIKLNKILPKSLHSITKLTTTAIVESHYSDFENNITYNPKEFKGYQYEISTDVSKDVDSKISILRTDSLTGKEISTYKELDRLSEKYKLEPKLRFLRSLSSSELELGFFNLHIYGLLSHNLYESFRFQLGGHTNYKLSTDFRLGGYIAKATLGGNVKGGGEVTFFINKKQGGELTLRAETDVLPAGRTNTKYLTPKDELTAKSNNIYNDIYFDYKKLELSYQQDFLKNVDITFSVDYQRQKADFNYTFRNYSENTWYNYVNTAVRLRYAPNVKYIKTLSGKNTLQDKPPYYYFTYAKSWNLFDNSSTFHKLYLSALYSFMSKWGTTEIIGNAGAIFGGTPIMNTYEGMGVAKNGKSLWGKFSVKGFQTFETMEPSLYFSDQFTSIQITHHLRPIRVNEFKSLYFALVYKGLLGTMESKSDHSQFYFEIPKNYYQEVGLEANKLLLGIIGAAAYYRVGAYHKGKFDKNLYLKLSLNL